VVFGSVAGDCAEAECASTINPTPTMMERQKRFIDFSGLYHDPDIILAIFAPPPRRDGTEPHLSEPIAGSRV